MIELAEAIRPENADWTEPELETKLEARCQLRLLPTFHSKNRGRDSKKDTDFFELRMNEMVKRMMVL